MQEPSMEYNEHNSEYGPAEKSEELLADERLLAGFSALSHAELCALIESGRPAMNRDDLRFCQTYYQSEKRFPSLGELRFLDRWIALRSASAQSAVLGTVTAEDTALAQTYEDLCAKIKALLPDRRLPFGLSELAKIGGSYLRMIGREADAQELSAPTCDMPRAEQVLRSASGVPLLCINADEPTRTCGGERSETAFLLLTLGEDAEVDYEEAISAFCADPELTPLYSNTLRVGRYGLIGTLTWQCGGVLADLSRLPDTAEEPMPLSRLADGYEGCLLLSAPRANTPFLSELAPRHGLRATYFAKATDSGRFCTLSETRPSVNWRLSFLRTLLEGKTRRDCLLPKEELRSVCRHRPLLLQDRTGECRPLMAATAWQAGRLTLSCAYGEVEQNGFSVGINTALDALLGVIASGADRRCVGLSFSYSFPAEQAGDDSLANSLALLLGAYRVMIELACPEEASQVRFAAGVPSLACTAFSPLNHPPISSLASARESRLVFLSVIRTADGLPDFEQFRRLCDRFYTLCREGKVLAARAVLGDLSDAVGTMTKDCGMRCLSRTEAYDGAFCQGILCQVAGAVDLPVVGELLPLSKDTAE